MSYDNYEDELMARVRRIETRLTVFMEAQGVPTQVRRPERNSFGDIVVPTRGTSMQEILAFLRRGEETLITCDGVELCRVTKV